jgi:hypothetical protein
MTHPFLLVLALVAPASAPGVRSDHWELGPLRLDQRSELVWPHAYVPYFTLVPDRRRAHRLTLGLDLPGLRGVAFDAVVVEPSDDPFLRARTAGLPTGEGARAYAWMGARVRLPGGQWQLGVGRAAVAAGLAGAFLRPGDFRVSLLRPL